MDSMKDYQIIYRSLELNYKIPIWFGKDLWEKENPILSTFFQQNKCRKGGVIVESAILQSHPELSDKISQKLQSLDSVISPIPEILSLQGGESCKNLNEVMKLCQWFNEKKLCRHSVVITIGGGAFLDTVGFAASLFHRGIRLLRCPSTILSQCDSGVGVKNAINAFDKKNLLGCFNPPFAVFNDVSLLSSLPDMEWRSGIPEAIKVALIKDENFYHWLLAHYQNFIERDEETIQQLIQRSAILHLDHIINGGDPYEMGSARPLDCGHWIAHKLEAMTHHRIGHGYAVTIGLLIDIHQSVDLGFFNKQDLENLATFFYRLGFRFDIPELYQRNQNQNLTILDGIEEFREHLGGKLQITIPQGIGSKLELDYIDPNRVESALQWLSQFQP